jgi:hypothetical protein
MAWKKKSAYNPAVERRPLAPDALDALQSIEEVDLKSMIWRRLGDIGYFGSRGMWNEYINSVNILENDLMGYLTLDNSYTKKYWDSLKEANNKTKENESMPDELKFEYEYRQRDWKKQKKIEKTIKKHRALAAFLFDIGFYPGLGLE